MNLFSRKTIDDIKDLNTKRLQLAARIDHDQHLNPNDKLLARTLLQTHFNPKMNGQCNPSHRTLITTTGGLSKSSIIRSSKELKARGVFTTYQPGRTTQQYESCEYTFNWNWVGSCEWRKCKNCISSRERNAAMGISLPPIPEKIMGVKKRRHGCQKTESWVSNQGNHGCQGCDTNNVIETTEPTTQKNTHEGVCDSDSSSDERKFEIEEFKFSGNEVSDREFNSSLKAQAPRDASDSLGEEPSNLSEEDDPDLAPFAHLAQDHFPSHHEDEIPSSRANINSTYTKADESCLQENINSFASQNDNFVAGISVARGQLGWVTSKNERPLREWLISMGLPRFCVEQMRWQTMIECYNDQTNATINSLNKQHHAVPVNNLVAPPQYLKDQEVIEVGLTFWQYLMSGQAIVTVPRGFPDAKPYFHTILATTEDIHYFCSLTNRDAEIDVAALQSTRAELAMAYFQLNDHYVSLPCSKEVLCSCIAQMQRETKELGDKQSPSDHADEDGLFA